MSMNQAFVEYYRCPERFADFQLSAGPGHPQRGFFRFGPDIVCYGFADIVTQPEVNDTIADALLETRINGRTCILPFNPTEVIHNLRQERYLSERDHTNSAFSRLVRDAYYLARPYLPVAVRRHLQRASLRGWEKKLFPRWPVDRSVDLLFEKLMQLSLEGQNARIPFIWFWPEAHSSCLIMTHDVETAAGLNGVGELMDINDSYGIKSSFQIIPEERYLASAETLSQIRSRGFEINVHDLKHDGHLFDEYEQFKQSAARINEYANRFGSNGFRSGVLYRNLDWYGAFSFSYDMSVPNVAHLDPQPGGCCTVMPYFIGNILELPLTVTQDYSLFNIIGTYSLDLWRTQIKLIVEQHGMVSFNIHPDYLVIPEAKSSYHSILKHLAELRKSSGLWCALPGDVDCWWRQRADLKLVERENEWLIVGLGSERARVAYATLEDGELRYSFN